MHLLTRTVEAFAGPHVPEKIQKMRFSHYLDRVTRKFSYKYRWFTWNLKKRLSKFWEKGRKLWVFIRNNVFFSEKLLKNKGRDLISQQLGSPNNVIMSSSVMPLREQQQQSVIFNKTSTDFSAKKSMFRTNSSNMNIKSRFIIKNNIKLLKKKL